jgi:citrate lyase gamma subunit
MTKRRRVEEVEQRVEPIRRTLLNAMEHMGMENHRLVLLDRGSISLVQVLGQAYDGVNVTALDVQVGEVRFVDVRKLDKALELRLQAAWRRSVLRTAGVPERPAVRLVVTIVIS